MLTKKVLSDIVEWDIHTWSKGILYWNETIDRFFPDNNKIKSLDIGARDGGTSLFFALKGLECICSDLDGPTDKAKELHRKYGVSELVSYEPLDCTCMNYPDEFFDIVSFKSVMGGVGANNNDRNMQKAFDEIFRVLKPGGILLFCENIQGSRFHMLMRKNFVKWSKYWNYVSLDYMTKAMGRYSNHEIHTFGFFSCMIKNNPMIHWLDVKLCKLIKPRNHYMCYGYARK